MEAILLVTPKEWGKIWHSFTLPTLRVEPIEILPNGFSSVHVHYRQNNLFVLVDGHVDIKVFADEEPNEGSPCTTYPLKRFGECCIVEAGEFHQFFAHTAARCSLR